MPAHLAGGTATSTAAVLEVGSGQDVYITMSNAATEDLDWIELICSFVDCRARRVGTAVTVPTTIEGSRQFWANAKDGGGGGEGGGRSGGGGGIGGGSGAGAGAGAGGGGLFAVP